MSLRLETCDSERDSTLTSGTSDKERSESYDDFYFGFLTTKDAEMLLLQEGDFLIRKCEVNGETTLSLAVRCKNQVKQFVINEKDGDYYFEEHREKSLRNLLEFHMKSKKAVSKDSQAILKRCVPQPPWYIKSKSVKLQKKLGEGAFGEVYLADFTTTDGKTKKAAVKALSASTEKEKKAARQNFLKEARVMRRLRHINVVHFYGIVAESEPLLIVMELCLGGTVLAFLRKNRGHVEEETKIRFATESAAGLAYLEKLHFIHRDVAARNCLLTKNYNVKISDFGMADEGVKIQDTNMTKVPIKWLAPETLQQRVYSSKSDVWAYGITVWEIFSEGVEPYPSFSNVQARAKIVVQNYRMEMPKNTPEPIANLVAECWKKDPNERPTFRQICLTLEETYKVD